MAFSKTNAKLINFILSNTTKIKAPNAKAMTP